MRYPKMLIVKISITLSIVLSVILANISFSGCSRKQEDSKKTISNDCLATITFEEVTVIKDTDRFLDIWNAEVSITPALAPTQETGQWMKILNGVGGDQGARLITDDTANFPSGNKPVVFGPTSLGPKGRTYYLRILIKSEEVDNDTTRILNDISLTVQQIEFPQIMCPSDDIVMKFKQDVVDLRSGELGQLEFRIRVKLGS